jgi:hypothetical protein
MKKQILAVSLLLAGGLCTLLAADFWQTKKFTEWSEKEVQKMLSDSPWAAKVSIPRPPGGCGGGGGKKGGGGMAFLPQDEGGGGGGGISGGSMGGSGGGGGGKGGGGTGGGTTFSSEIELTVRWVTALPIKQANVVRQYGKEAGTSPDAVKRLAREEQFYIAQIEGFPGRLTPEAVTAGTQLVVKGVPPISPAQVQLTPGASTGRGAPPTNIFLVFPKAQPGAHVLKVEDGEIEVDVNAPGLKLKRKFKLKDMVFDGKLEI